METERMNALLMDCQYRACMMCGHDVIGMEECSCMTTDDEDDEDDLEFDAYGD